MVAFCTTVIWIINIEQVNPFVIFLCVHKNRSILFYAFNPFYIFFVNFLFLFCFLSEKSKITPEFHYYILKHLRFEFHVHVSRQFVSLGVFAVLSDAAGIIGVLPCVEKLFYKTDYLFLRETNIGKD